MTRMTRDQALDLKNSESWKLICLELQDLIDGNSSKLLLCEPGDLIKLQETIKALKFCMNLPDIIAEREE